MTTPTVGSRALVRSEKFYDLMEHSIEQTVENIRDALSTQDTNRIRGEMKHVMMMSEKGQQKFLNGFTELVIELLHEGDYPEALLLIGVLGENRLTSGNLWVLQDFAKVLNGEDLDSPVSIDMADPVLIQRMEQEFPTEWQQYQETVSIKKD